MFTVVVYSNINNHIPELNNTDKDSNLQLKVISFSCCLRFD